jgi:hypothetical protein
VHIPVGCRVDFKRISESPSHVSKLMADEFVFLDVEVGPIDGDDLSLGAPTCTRFA